MLSTHEPMDRGSDAQVYGEHYYQHYVSDSGVPYDRIEPWLSFFSSMADRIVREIKPGSVLDVGCAKGFLVESLRDRGVEAFGLDISAYAISQVREDIKPHCWVASVTEPLPRRYDLIVCVEVLEHLPREHAEQAVANLCRSADDILFSSSPEAEDDPTHLNVQPVEYWAERFAEHGFYRALDFDAAFVAPYAARFRRAALSLPALAHDYERRLWAAMRREGELQAALAASQGRESELQTTLAVNARARHLYRRARLHIEHAMARLEGDKRQVEADKAEIFRRYRRVRHQLSLELAELTGIKGSLAWRMISGYRAAKTRLAPPGSPQRAAYDLLLRSIKSPPRESPKRAAAPVGRASAGPAHAWGESVLIVSGSFGAMERYRCHHLREQLGLLGVRCEVLQIDDPRLTGMLGDYDVMILHRIAYSEFIDTMVEIARGRPAFVLFDIDDLVFDPSKAALIDGLRTLEAEERRRYLEAMLGYRRTLLLSDGAIVATDHLAEVVTELGRPAWVHRNGPSLEMLALAEQASGARRMPDGKVVIGYASGTRTHNRDFAEIEGALEQVLVGHPHVELWVLGDLDLSERWQRWADRVKRVPLVPWRELPGLLAQLDINLAPLETDNPFCRSKSELKYLEAAAVGVPTVASRVGAFEVAIRDGDNGFLARTADEWVACLERLVADAGLRRRMGENARADLHQRYHPAVLARQIVATLDRVAATVRRPGIPPTEAIFEGAQDDRALIDEIAPEMLLRVIKEQQLAHDLLDGLAGLEIGAAGYNPFGLKTRNVMLREGYDFYASEQRRLGVEPLDVDIWAPADAIPVPDRSEDFVLSSHVVEHLPNLVAAFVEWNRIVRDGGYVFMIVPLRSSLKEDRSRELTPLEHFVDDFTRGVTLETHPTEDVPGGRMGHYHTFTPESLLQVIDWMRNNELCDWFCVTREDVDSKAGNGFTLCFQVFHHR